jgi:hypothetical protein
VTRTLLRHVATGLYVQGPGRWTGSPEEACDFKILREAIRFVEHEQLRQMELAFVSPYLCRYTEVPLELLGWGASISEHRAEAA